MLLLFGPKGEDRPPGERVVHGHDHADAGVRVADLLERRDIREDAHPHAPVLLRDEDPHEAHFTELRHDAAREGMALVPFCSARKDLVSGEIPGKFLDVLDIFWQVDERGGGHGCTPTGFASLLTLLPAPQRRISTRMRGSSMVVHAEPRMQPHRPPAGAILTP